MVSGMEVLRHVLSDIVDMGEVYPYATIFDSEGRYTFKFIYKNDAVTAGQVVEGRRALKGIERKTANLNEVEGFDEYSNMELYKIANNLDQILDQLGMENKGLNKMVVNVTEEYDCSNGEGMRYATMHRGTFLAQRSTLEEFFRESEERFNKRGDPLSRFFIDNGFVNFTFPNYTYGKLTEPYKLTFKKASNEKKGVGEFIDSTFSSVDKAYTLLKALRLNKDKLSELEGLYRDLMNRKE